MKYETQYEPPFARAATRALKVRQRLGSNEGLFAPFPDKPKGMHWKTYRKLQRVDVELLAAWERGIGARFAISERKDA